MKLIWGLQSWTLVCGGKIRTSLSTTYLTFWNFGKGGPMSIATIVVRKFQSGQPSTTASWTNMSWQHRMHTLPHFPISPQEKSSLNWSKMTLNYRMMVGRYPNLKEDVGNSIPICEIFSLPDGKLARWSTASYALAPALCLKISKSSLKNILDFLPHVTYTLVWTGRVSCWKTKLALYSNETTQWSSVTKYWNFPCGLTKSTYVTGRIWVKTTFTVVAIFASFSIVTTHFNNVCIV